MTDLPLDQQHALDEVRRMTNQRKRQDAVYGAARAAEIASIKRARAVGCSLDAIAAAMGGSRQMAWKLSKETSR